ncbi:MAG: hypothetical protein EB060_07910 [Proteobacteria bacterium]|nr:hypothetical protein [Pseudomonadota bacterium]
MARKAKHKPTNNPPPMNEPISPADSGVPYYKENTSHSVMVAILLFIAVLVLYIAGSTWSHNHREKVAATSPIVSSKAQKQVDPKVTDGIPGKVEQEPLNTEDSSGGSTDNPEGNVQSE